MHNVMMKWSLFFTGLIIALQVTSSHLQTDYEEYLDYENEENEFHRVAVPGVDYFQRPISTWTKRMNFIVAVPGVDYFQRSRAISDPVGCVMYDKCTDTLNCMYNGPPKPLDDDNLETLKLWCPELVEEYGNNLCCAPSQIIDLTTNLALPRAVIGRRPSCYYNFRQHFCNLTCSPIQSTYMNVSETSGVEPNMVVTKLDIYIAEDYVQETFDSCKNVIMSSTNGPAMDLLCGNWGATGCTPHRWFDYLGSSNGFSPFDIIFKYVSSTDDDPEFKNFDPFNVTTYHCFESPPGSDHPCSCLDCLESCPPGEDTTVTSVTPTDVPDDDTTFTSVTPTDFPDDPVTSSEPASLDTTTDSGQQRFNRADLQMASCLLILHTVKPSLPRREELVHVPLGTMDEGDVIPSIA